MGVDAVLTSESDVVTDDGELLEAQAWLRREELQGREIETAGGTKVGTVGDVFLDEEAAIVGYALARVHVTGPVADRRVVLNDHVLDNGGRDGVMTIDLSKAERPASEPSEAGTEAGPTDNSVSV